MNIPEDADRTKEWERLKETWWTTTNWLEHVWERFSWHVPFTPRRVVVVWATKKGEPGKFVGVYRSLLKAMRALASDGFPEGHGATFYFEKV